MTWCWQSQWWMSCRPETPPVSWWSVVVLSHFLIRNMTSVKPSTRKPYKCQSGISNSFTKFQVANLNTSLCSLWRDWSHLCCPVLSLIWRSASLWRATMCPISLAIWLLLPPSLDNTRQSFISALQQRVWRVSSMFGHTRRCNPGASDCLHNVTNVDHSGHGTKQFLFLLVTPIEVAYHLGALGQCWMGLSVPTLSHPTSLKGS